MHRRTTGAQPLDHVHQAVTAVLARNLAITLVQLIGAEGALRALESTLLDAAVASDE